MSLSDSRSFVGQGVSTFFSVTVVAALCLSSAQAEAIPPRNGGDELSMMMAGVDMESFRTLQDRSSDPLSKRQAALTGATDSTIPGTASGTSVALIILYSITGIITALFLLIIITGAIRAHRHPERYGPRANPRFGRPRQSRAKGLAAAVLDTIPIVRFGASTSVPEVDKQAVDVEMQDGNTTSESRPSSSADAEAGASQERVAAPPSEQEGNAAGAVEAPDTAAATPTATNTTEEAMSSQKQCPVCMEDFAEGQEVRMLPCHHHFHPVCIDPWLLNVSGSCPLCRIDLHPEKKEDVEGETRADETAGSAGEAANGPSPPPHHDSRRLSRYLHIARGTSGEERMAALRQLRDESSYGSREARRRIRMPELGISRIGRALSRRITPQQQQQQQQETMGSTEV